MPAVGNVPLTLLNLIPDKDENLASVNVVVDDPAWFGFLIIPIWANFVSIGKSFVESSKRAYTKTLSAPSSL